MGKLPNMWACPSRKTRESLFLNKTRACGQAVSVPLFGAYFLLAPELEVGQAGRKTLESIKHSKQGTLEAQGFASIFSLLDFSPLEYPRSWVSQRKKGKTHISCMILGSLKLVIGYWRHAAAHFLVWYILSIQQDFWGTCDFRCLYPGFRLRSNQCPL